MPTFAPSAKIEDVPWKSLTFSWMLFDGDETLIGLDRAFLACRIHNSKLNQPTWDLRSTSNYGSNNCALEETHIEPENHARFVEDHRLPKAHVQVPCEPLPWCI